MTTRILPPEEYFKLDGTEAKDVWSRLPDGSQVIVVEHEGEIVGCWIAMKVLHAECLYIAPEHRKKSSVGRRLLSALRTIAEREHAKSVWTAAMEDDVRGLLKHFGATQVPGDHFIMPMGRVN